MIDTKAMREKILDLAMRGKLVPQDPNDEPASALLERICVEKQRLFEEGKLKKKDIQEIEVKGEEIPFDIPDSWQWTKLGSLLINRDGERIPVSVTERKGREKIFDYYGASGVIDKIDNFLFDAKLLLIGEDGANLVTRTKPIAFIAEGKYWVNNHAHVLDALDKITLDYVKNYINKISLLEYITGSAQPKMNQAKMNSILVPVPPLLEQRRIVKKVEELFEKLSSIEQEQQALQQLSEQLKQKVLNTAMRGKLVSQDPNDEPASVLLEKIRTEKQRLFEEGKIKKKDLQESPIVESDNTYYGRRPFGWDVVRLIDVTDITMGQSPKGSSVSDTKTENAVEFHQGKSYFGEKTLTNSSKYTTEITKLIDVKCVVMSVRAPVGDVNLLDRPIVIGRGLTAIIPIKFDLYFLYKFLQTKKSGLEKLATGTTFKAIGGEILRNQLIPIPPLAEQKRIVSVIEQVEKSIQNLL